MSSKALPKKQKSKNSNIKSGGMIDISSSSFPIVRSVKKTYNHLPDDNALVYDLKIAQSNGNSLKYHTLYEKTGGNNLKDKSKTNTNTKCMKGGGETSGKKGCGCAKCNKTNQTKNPQKNKKIG